MSDLARFRDTLTEVRDSLNSIETGFAKTALQLATDILSNTVAGVGDAVNAGSVNDIAFALNDMVLATDDLTPADAERIAPLIATLQQEVEALKTATALPAGLIARMRVLQGKLKARKSAIERQTYSETPDGSTPPHPPEALREEALPIQQELQAAGFATPALDDLIADPASLRFGTIGEIVDELDVIAGD